MSEKKHTKSEVAQVGRFGLVGVLNTVVDFVVLNVLVTTILPKSLTLTTITIFGTSIVVTGVIVAGLISGTAAMINSFIFNTRFTFRAQNVDRRHTIYFFLITIFGLYIIRPVILKIMTDVWIWPSQIVYGVTNGLNLPFSQDFDERNLALLVAIVLILGYNYIMYKRFVFVQKPAKSKEITSANSKKSVK